MQRLSKQLVCRGWLQGEGVGDTFLPSSPLSPTSLHRAR